MIDTRGLKSWETCALCHGVDGDSHMAKFPKLAGQSIAYMTKQLRDFKNKRRSNDKGAMTSMAESKSEETLIEAARYFSVLPAPPANKLPQVIDRNARKLFEHGDPARGLPACRTCHGREAHIPWLQAQHAAYLEKQLLDFKWRDRRNDLDGVMRRIARLLSVEEVTALALFLSGQTRPAVLQR